MNFKNALGDLDMKLFKAADLTNHISKSSSYTNNSEKLDFNGLAPGKYYIQVYGYGGVNNPNYTLTLTNEDSKYNNFTGLTKDVYIVDNDLPTAKIIAGPSASELFGQPSYFSVSLSNPAPRNSLSQNGIAVNYRLVGGTASNGNDYQLISPTGTVLIAPGNIQNNLLIVPIDDKLAEGLNLKVTGRTVGAASNNQTQMTLTVETNLAASATLDQGTKLKFAKGVIGEVVSSVTLAPSQKINLTSSPILANITVSNTNSPAGESKDNVFDSNGNSKWLLYASTGWIQYQLPNNQSSVVREYSLTSANDASGRDPKNWQLQGSKDGINFTTIDQRSNEIFSQRLETRTFTVNNSTDYSYYRLNITGNNGAAELQLADLALFAPTEKINLTSSPILANITVSNTNSPAGESKDKVFDSNANSKWLLLNSTGWIQYQLPNNQSSVLREYSLTSANDASGRDPKNWQLQGSKDGINFTPIDQRSNEIFSQRLETRTFTVNNSTDYSYYRLNITGNNGAAELQLADLALFADKPQATISVNVNTFDVNSVQVNSLAKVAEETVTVELLAGDGYKLDDNHKIANLAIADDDVPGVRVVEVGYTTVAGESEAAQFEVSLLSEPTQDVKIRLTPGAEVEFVNPINPTTVKVKKDIYTLNSFSSDILDVKLNGLVPTNKGDALTLDVQLKKQPFEIVTVTITDGLETTSQVTAPVTLTFTPDNWNQPQQSVVVSYLDRNNVGIGNYQINAQLKFDQAQYQQQEGIYRTATDATSAVQTYYFDINRNGKLDKDTTGKATEPLTTNATLFNTEFVLKKKTPTAAAGTVAVPEYYIDFNNNNILDVGEKINKAWDKNNDLKLNADINDPGEGKFINDVAIAFIDTNNDKQYNSSEKFIYSEFNPLAMDDQAKSEDGSYLDQLW
ncbi:discoidin domain-containing protein [Dolichospermum sp. LEGE 00246]|uniref:discoidin domain-containing protein n=1 Tax=Dolichospermum sp. LEGE 00246 TaxID=1828605 RepID=UPI00351C1855